MWKLSYPLLAPSHQPQSTIQSEQISFVGLPAAGLWVLVGGGNGLESVISIKHIFMCHMKNNESHSA